MNVLTLFLAGTLSFETLEFPSISTIVSHLSEMMLPVLIILGVFWVILIIVDWETYSEFIGIRGYIVDFELSVSEITGQPKTSGRPVVEYTALDSKSYRVRGDECPYMSEQEREKGETVYYNIYLPQKAYDGSLFFGGVTCGLFFVLTLIFSFIYITIKYTTGAF